MEWYEHDIAKKLRTNQKYKSTLESKNKKNTFKMSRRMKIPKSWSGKMN